MMKSTGIVKAPDKAKAATPADTRRAPTAPAKAKANAKAKTDAPSGEAPASR